MKGISSVFPNQGRCINANNTSWMQTVLSLHLIASQHIPIIVYEQSNQTDLVSFQLILHLHFLLSGLYGWKFIIGTFQNSIWFMNNTFHLTVIFHIMVYYNLTKYYEIHTNFTESKLIRTYNFINIFFKWFYLFIRWKYFFVFYEW